VCNFAEPSFAAVPEGIAVANRPLVQQAFSEAKPQFLAVAQMVGFGMEKVKNALSFNRS